MESQQKDKDENLFTRDTADDLSSGPLVTAADDNDEEDDDDEDNKAADDELDEDL